MTFSSKVKNWVQIGPGTGSAEAAESGEPAVVVDALADGRFVGAQSVQALRLRSIMVVPLRVREVVLGARAHDLVVERDRCAAAIKNLANWMLSQ